MFSVHPHLLTAPPWSWLRCDHVTDCLMHAQRWSLALGVHLLHLSPGQRSRGREDDNGGRSHTDASLDRGWICDVPSGIAAPAVLICRNHKLVPATYHYTAVHNNPEPFFLFHPLIIFFGFHRHGFSQSCAKWCWRIPWRPCGQSAYQCGQTLDCGESHGVFVQWSWHQYTAARLSGVEDKGYSELLLNPGLVPAV